ncbi:MAG: stage V sporulation T C-terminal domain-containing protein [Bacillota bacterium]
MRSTGIVRRIDELGRVVIPKEIRRTMRIKEGEELEVFATGDNSLVLKKYSAVGEAVTVINEYAHALYVTNGYTTIVTDMDKIVSAIGDIKSFAVGDKLTDKCLRAIGDRRTIVLDSVASKGLFISDSTDLCNIVMSPIIRQGDVLGAVICMSHQTLDRTAVKITDTASAFLSGVV